MAPNNDDHVQKTSNTLKPEPDEQPSDTRFSAEEEAALLSQSHEQKATANNFFTTGSYSDAITRYGQAIASCPNYLDYELAVLHSNIAACHLKLKEWKEAVDSASRAVDGLERLDPVPKPKAANGKDGQTATEGKQGQEVVEIDDETERRLEDLSRTGRSLDDVRKLRVKALLRRAKARSELNTWASLQGAAEDYKQLSNMPSLAPLDAQTVRRALTELPPRLEEAQKREMADMMGKLKQLGNGILKPFGLSTDNFNMVKDEASGGYSMQFNQDK
ncbi:hypothetical protein NA57DRAFT_79937 [Rhizodiscina lignyota]|uniref:Tetratricopeptide repeat protein 1 n=1 Tax=Rhizodiscina lignyota TaxID=1504668 RepID=A0A9P4M2L5_9PEZI|nr:hypothetical protein NA57DRAFT_79937 [Rhizodiscina lignyota]